MSFPWAEQYTPKNPVMVWIDEKLPLPRLAYNAVGAGYPVPRNLNYFWNFGVLAGLALVIQIVTGVIMAMHYGANDLVAFSTVEQTMRDVNAGWLMRYAHANGASFFFIVVYLHIFRGLYFGSYKAPREMVWLLGLVIFLLMMATAFMGYVLPWGQMSYWGAKVITGLFGAIPVVGEPIQTWLLGGFAPGNASLNRFFSLLPAALRDRRGHHPAHLGAAYSRFLEPDRRGSEGATGHCAVPPLLYRKGWLRRGRVSHRLLRAAVLRPQLPGPPG